LCCCTEPSFIVVDNFSPLCCYTEPSLIVVDDVSPLCYCTEPSFIVVDHFSLLCCCTEPSFIVVDIVSLICCCSEPSFIVGAASWSEQREFLSLAIDALKDHPVVVKINSELSQLIAQVPELHGIHYKILLNLFEFPGHDIKLHPHRVKLYRVGCVGSGLVLAKALT